MYHKKVQEIPLSEPDHTDLRKLTRYLIDQRKIIFSITFCIFLFGMLHALFSPIRYQSSMLLKIQRKQDVVGSDASLTGESSVLQMALIKSEFILKPVIQTINANTIQSPEAEFNSMAKLNKNLLITDLTSNSENPNNVVAILRLTLSGRNPAQITKTLEAIANITQQQNIKLRAEAAEKSLGYLNRQIPLVKKALQSAESQLNRYEALNGKFNLRLQTDNLVNHLADINTQIEKSRLKKMELLEQYTNKHPFILAINQELQALQSNRDALIQQLNNLPDSKQKVDELSREVTVQNDLYMALLNKIHQLEVIKASSVSDIEVISNASKPYQLPSLKLPVLAIFFLIIGLVIGCLVALILKIVKIVLPQQQYSLKMASTEQPVSMVSSASYSKHDIK